MNQRFLSVWRSRSACCLGLLSVVACASAANGTKVRAASAAPATPAPATAVVSSTPALPPTALVPTTPAGRSNAHALTANAPAVSALEHHDDNQQDRVFIENAERAIGEYREFIARAGSSPEYAAAVKRSREKIQDLRDTLRFVRAEGAQP